MVFKIMYKIKKFFSKKYAALFFIPIILFIEICCKSSADYNKKQTASNPKRIISLLPYITEELYLLGEQDKLVGVTTYCIRPEPAKLKEKVGNVIEVNVEKIFALKPDIIFASPLTNSYTKTKLIKLGLNVISFNEPKNFQDICDQFLILGNYINKKSEAENIVAEVRKKIEKIKKEVSDKPNRMKILIQLGTKPIWVAAGETFLNDLIEFAGGINIAKNGITGEISKEEIIKSNPDAIIITDMGIISDEEKKNWEKFKDLNAVKNKKIFIMEAYKLCSPTPVSFTELLEELIYYLYEKK